MDSRLKRRARGTPRERFLEQRDGEVDALELGEEDEGFGAYEPTPSSASRSVAIVRARVHSPAA